MGQVYIELAPPAGIFSDDTSFASEGRWADGSNVRFLEGKPETLGRVVAIMPKTVGAGVLAANANSMFAWTSGSNSTVTVVVGAASALYYGNSTILADITPADSPTGTYWAFASWGDDLMAAPRLGKLYHWVIGVGVPTIVTQAPAQMAHMLVTAERQVLALGCNEEVSTTYNPLCIRGSDLEDYTNWTTTSADNVFEHILEGDGKIVAGRRVGPYIAVWTNGALYQGQFLGDPEQTYRFDFIARIGLIGPGAVTVFEGVAYWMSPDHGIYRWAPGALPQSIPCSVSKDMRTHITLTNRADQATFATTNSLYGEIWWFYPDSRDSGGFRYIAYNIRENCWFKGQLDRRAAYEAQFLNYPGTTSSNFRNWRPFLAVDGTGRVLSHEVEIVSAETADTVPWFIQSADQYFNSGRIRVMVRGVEPDFQAQTNDVSMTVLTKSRPQATPTTWGPYTLTAGATKKDFRASGMIMSVKFAGTTGQARLGKPVFDTVTMGER